MAVSDVTANPKLAQWAAVGALAVYAASLIWLATGLNSSEAGWTRAVFIMNGAEAIAFAAAGWLWGTQVARGALQATQDHVDSVKSDLQQKDSVVVATRSELEQKIKELSQATAAIIAAHVAAAGPLPTAEEEDGGMVAGVTKGGGPAPGRPDIRTLLEKTFPQAFPTP